MCHLSSLWRRRPEAVRPLRTWSLDGVWLAYAWQRTWLKIAGTWGLLGAAITLHAVYNLLIAYGGAAQYVAYALPVLLVAAGRLSTFRLSRMK